MARRFEPAALPRFQHPPGDERNICQKCCKILLPPVRQSPCGHRFCLKCVDAMFHYRDTIICPVREEGCPPFRKQQFIPDFAIVRELMQMEVYCTFGGNQDGCRDSMKWKVLAEHERTCRFNTQLCTYSDCPVVKKVLEVEILVKDNITRLSRNHAATATEVNSIQENLGRISGALLHDRESVQEKQSDNDDRIELLQKQITDIKCCLQELNMFQGQLMWKITNYSKLKENAELDPQQTCLRSPPFYTSPRGFKICIHCFPNGHGMGKGTYLSLYYVLMKGEFDDVLPWPFELDVSLSIVDGTDTRPNITLVYHNNPSHEASAQPARAKSAAFGYATFCLQDRLDKEGYLRDDTLIVSAKVTKRFSSLQANFTEYLQT